MQRNLVVTLLLSIIIALFAILNAEAIPVNLIFVNVNVSAALVILISASMGAIIVFSGDAISKLKSKKQIKELDKSNQALNTSNFELKEKAIKLEHENELMKLEIGNLKAALAEKEYDLSRNDSIDA